MSEGGTPPLQNGFSFQPGQLMPTAPTIFPGESELFMFLELAASFGSYIPVIGWIVALVAEIILIVLQIIDDLVAIFTGTPLQQKTLTVAARFHHGKSPISQFAGAQIVRNWTQNGIALSDSDPSAQKILGAIRKQAEAGLVACGATQAEAVQAIDEVWSNTRTATQALPGILDQWLPQTITMVGEEAMQVAFADHYNKWILKGKTPRFALQKAIIWLYQYGKMEWLSHIQYRINPIPPPPMKPPPQQCPTGFHWDFTQNMCVPDVPPPPPPGPAPQPCFPTGNNGQGDELMDGLGCVAQNLSVLAYWIPQIIGQAGGSVDPVTCTQLTALVNVIADELGNIAVAISGTHGAPVDLTAVVSALTGIGTMLGEYPLAWSTISNALGLKLDAITAAIKSGGVDTSGIVTALKDIGTQTPIAQSFRDAMLAEGLITNVDAQLMTGSPSLLAILEVLIPELHDILKFFHIIGADVPGATIFDAIPPIVAWLKAQWPAVKVMLEGLLATATSPPAKLFLGEIESIGEAVATWAGAPAIAALQFVEAPALAMRNVKPGDQVAAAQETFGKAWAMGETAHLLAIIGGIVPNGLGPAFSGWAAQVATAAGFREIAAAIHRSVYGIAFARPTAYQVNSLARSLYPRGATGQDLFARGLITAAQRDELDSYEGMNTTYAPLLQTGAYRGLNARQMLRLVETNLFSQAEISDELTFSGLRPASQSRMLRAAPYLATASQRSSLIATIESAYVAGLLTPQDRSARVDAAETNEDRDSLISARGDLQILVAEAKDLEAEYTTLFVGGLIDDATLRSYLQGIGLQPWKVNTVAGKAEARANARVNIRTIGAAAALARETAVKERAAAVANFVDGNIDAAALLAALLLTGLTPTQSAAWVDLAILRKGGGLRWIYGLQLPASQAAVLRGRVAALTDQRKRLQITDADYVSQLTALGIGPRYVNWLDAAADAMISPKTSAFAIPVETN